MWPPGVSIGHIKVCIKLTLKKSVVHFIVQLLSLPKLYSNVELTEKAINDMYGRPKMFPHYREDDR